MKIPQICTQKFSCRSDGGKYNGARCGIGYLIGFLTFVLKLNREKTADHSAYCRFECSHVVILINSHKYRNSNQDESLYKTGYFISISMYNIRECTLSTCILVGIWIMKT
jgi:hypothetical protein